MLVRSVFKSTMHALTLLVAICGPVILHIHVDASVRIAKVQKILSFAIISTRRPKSKGIRPRCYKVSFIRYVPEPYDKVSPRHDVLDTALRNKPTDGVRGCRSNREIITYWSPHSIYLSPSLPSSRPSDYPASEHPSFS
jgi:hypothetical protein